jgi:hypothetical protein
MHRRTFMILTVTLLAACGLPAKMRSQIQQRPNDKRRSKMEIKRVGSQPSSKGPAE